MNSKMFKCCLAATGSVLSVVVAATSAHALSLNFEPAGSILIDADQIPDIETSVGSQITFDILLETFGVPVGADVNQIAFDVNFDDTELNNFSYAPVLGTVLEEFPSPFGFDARFTHSNLTIARNLSEVLLGRITFDVVGLFNDGVSDFETDFVSAVDFGTNASLNSIIGGQNQTVEVQAVPTPALLPGLLGFGATLLRKRKKATAFA